MTYYEGRHARKRKKKKPTQAGAAREDVLIDHPIAPIFDAHSRILILGSFPSVRSRESGFFYGHPQNRFWRVLAALFEEEQPITIDEKKQFLFKNGVALWDVIASCRIVGSADSSIRDAVPNDLTSLLSKAPITRIFANGGTATALYRRYLLPKTAINCLPLPSTSPANAAFSAEKLIEAWRVIL